MGQRPDLTVRGAENLGRDSSPFGLFRNKEIPTYHDPSNEKLD